MTDILCKWLNDDVKLSRRIDHVNFAKEFATGYLIGEVLNKYQLQDDFDQFSQTRTADSKLNNFTRLEPTLHLLEVPFDTNVARDIMTEKLSVATRLMYQVFVALNKKEKANLTGVAMETMRPAAPVKLENVGSKMYKERLKHMTPRQTDLNLEALGSRFHQNQIEREKVAFRERFEEQERHQDELMKKREDLIQKYKDSVSKKSEMLAKIQAATVQIPKPPPSKTLKAIQARKDARQLQEAQMAERDIAAFEEKLRRTLPPSKPMGDEEARAAAAGDVAALPDKLDLIKPSGNSEYINKIRKRLHEDEAARQEREKRRRKVLVDQLKAHEAQEEAHREEMLVNRLMRQSQQERRIAVQLLQARQEKDTIRKNRLMREKQYEERKLVEFEEALNREAELAHLAKVEYMEQTQKDKELNDKIMAERAEDRYRKHYDECGEVLSSVVDFVTKIGEYRELTNKLLPPKLMRDWTQLFCEGKPLYEVTDEPISTDPKPEQILEEERQLLLDEGDFDEYRQMIGEWNPLEGSDISGPPRNNPIVGHIVQRLFDLVHPPTPPPPPPEFPAFPIKACVVGKVFSGKSSVVKKLAETHRLMVLSIDELVKEAIEAHKDGEEMEIVDEPEPELEQPPPGSAGKVEGESVAGDPAAPPPVNDIANAQDAGDAAPKNESGAKAETGSKSGSAVKAESGGKPETPLKAESGAKKESGSKIGSATTAGSAISQKDNKENEAEEKQDDEGKEKTDPEKPVSEDTLTDLVSQENTMVKKSKSSRSAKSSTKSAKSSSSSILRDLESAQPQLSLRARLGGKAAKVLKRGKPLDDPILIEILVEAIRRIPEGTGWILDGFPATYGQAKALEKALSGYDGASREPSKTSVVAADKKDSKEKKMKKSSLAPDPKPVPPTPEPVSGINVVILFDIDDELCLKRSAGRTCAVMAGEVYQQEFRPPPDGSATGVGSTEKVIPVEDEAHDQEQIQHRLTTFQDMWPKMEKWFMKFGTLKLVDARLDQESVYYEVENILEETLRKLLGPPEEESLIEDTLPTDEVKEEEKPPEPEVPPPEPPKEDEEVRSRPSSKGSRKSSGKRSGSRGSKEKDKKDDKKSDKKDKSRSGSKADSAKKSPKGSRGKKSGKSGGPSPKSPKRGKSGKKVKTPEPEPEPEPEPPGTPPPQPGSDEWEYINEPIDPELSEILASHWEAVENTYIGASKSVFRKVRFERENIIRYYFQIRTDFLDYLRRPDTKQEYVSQFQKEFNDVSDDIRDDEETRCELHQRVDDLKETLWNICDERKEAAEKEREGIIGDGWLEDHTGLLTNHYITFMQGEVDRFQDTVRLLKDYYRGMEGKIPDQLPSEYARIPLIELPVTEKAPSPVNGGEEDSKPATPAAEESRSTPTKSGTPTGKKKKGSTEDLKESSGDQEEPAKPRIPLVPRRPASPDPNAAAKAKDKGKGKPTGKDAVEDTPLPPEDPDERLLFDSHCNGISAIDKIIAQEQAAREAEEAAEREKEALKELEKQKALAATAKSGKGGKDKKGKKSRSPSPKKGKGKETPQPQPTPPPPEEETEEEKQKKKIKENARLEFFAAIQEEAQAAKTRLTLIKMISALVLADLKVKADEAYKEMNDWLGARFLKEMESIDAMSEILRHAIEAGTKLKEEVILQQDDFIVDEDVKTLRTPSPKPRPPAVEVVPPDMFTIDQIMKIHRQFSQSAPNGLVSLKGFTEIFLDLSALSHGTETMPDMWMNITPEKLDQLSVAVSADGEYIDWRAFLLGAAHPWPIPTQTELLQALATFKLMDQRSTGYVTREQFERMALWFDGMSHCPTPVDQNEPLPYDRLGTLKSRFFDIFADMDEDPPQLDYVNMLLYFAASPDPYEGFLRALSVASGIHMPRLNKRLTIRKPSRPSSQASMAVSVDLEIEKSESPEQQVNIPVPDDIPDDAVTARVPMEALARVLVQGQSMRGDSHRYAVGSDPEDLFSKERLAGVYQELGATELEPLPYSVLMEHPVIQDIISVCNTFRAPDLRVLMSNIPQQETTELQSLRTE